MRRMSIVIGAPFAVSVRGPSSASEPRTLVRSRDRRGITGRRTSGLQEIAVPSRVTPAPSPTARALQMLEMLQVRPGATADQIAARLGVSERAVRRYVEILREAGVAVDSSRGRYGGYRLGRGTRLPPVVFTEDEALVLVMAVLEGNPAATDTDELVGSALDKGNPSAPGERRPPGGDACDTRPRHPTTVPHIRTPPSWSVLVAAVASHCRVELQYRSEAATSGTKWWTRGGSSFDTVGGTCSVIPTVPAPFAATGSIECGRWYGPRTRLPLPRGWIFAVLEENLS